MRIDLFHNKIIKDTATAEFERSVAEVLVPLIEAECPAADEILFYEDLAAEELERDGRWIYPLTVKVGAEARRIFISWSFDRDSEAFATRSPYSYIGADALDFAIEREVPRSVEALLVGRALDYDKNAIKINVRAATDDVMLLAGRYSQTFVDEMAKQLTAEISQTLSIEGLSGSTIELEMPFAPGTYMEHTSENVTYRRLLMVDGASRPRDFWVKWTRIGGGAAHTVSDHIDGLDVLFEIAEDVPHKIREKEYRFLCSTNPNTYQAAMGKRGVTEWRDLIKRAIRRGEIVRLESELVIAERAEEVHDAMAELLDKHGYAIPTDGTEEPISYDTSILDMARAALQKSEAHVAAGENDAPKTADDLAEPAAELEAEDDGFIFGGLDFTDGKDSEEEEPASVADAVAFGEGEEPEREAVAEESTQGLTVEDALALDEPATEDEPIAEDKPATEDEPVSDADSPEERAREVEDLAPLTIDELLSRAEAADREDRLLMESETATEDAPEEIAEEEKTEEAKEPNTDYEPEVVVAASEVYEGNSEDSKAAIRREIEAEVRLEYEAIARARAEAELQKILAETRMLREENERLARLAKEAKELKDRALSAELDAEERARASEEQLIREREAKAREEARERDRLAEAARIAVEEQRRKEEEERLAREREAAEAARLEAEAQALREAEEAERRLEEERYLREAEEAERRLAEERRLEEAARAEEFISRRAKIIFRNSTDSNIIPTIGRIVKDTVNAQGKQNVRIHMKAYNEDRNTVTLDVLKMPAAEEELLITIVKAIGNAGIGVTRITIE